ncbi:hypothetical protein [Chryseobacterium gregarium]|uniref:hypothetical protein n=1 Tax=Chryseobacterium gregarium TaxID=456299 RepID=UPI00042539C5|nr:hypothetical protein [Chryseobacterium gregarium]
MSYIVQKWNKFKFVLHPSEFEIVFFGLEYFIAITNRRVPIDYKIEDKTSIFQQYELYYNNLTSGRERKEEERKSDIYTQITDNPKYIDYEIFESEENNQLKKFKRAIQREPVINISPFSLTVDEKKNQLRVNIFDGTGNSNIGLEFSYPKEIWQNGKALTTENLTTYKLYVELIKRIKKNARKAKAIRNGDTSSPDFWISERSLPEVNTNFGLKENSILLK